VEKERGDFLYEQERAWEEEVSNPWALRDRPIDYVLSKDIVDPYTGDTYKLNAGDPRLDSIRFFLDNYAKEAKIRVTGIPSLISLPEIEVGLGKGDLFFSQGKTALVSSTIEDDTDYPDFYIYNGPREELRDKLLTIETTGGKYVFVRDSKSGKLYSVLLEYLEFVPSSSVSGRLISSKKERLDKALERYGKFKARQDKDRAIMETRRGILKVMAKQYAKEYEDTLRKGGI
jgi:hypothetical protein